MGARQGKLRSREKTIGHWPALSTPAARIEALKEAATFASGAAVVSKKDATTFATAFARHLEHLTKKATDKGKPDRWRYNVEKLGKIMLPTFGHWTLVEMSHRPDICRTGMPSFTSRRLSAPTIAPGSFGRSIGARRGAIDHCRQRCRQAQLSSPSTSPRKSRSTSKPTRLGARHGKLWKAPCIVATIYSVS